MTRTRLNAAYHGLFKAIQRQVGDQRGPQVPMKRMRQMPGVAEPVDGDHIRAGYFSVWTLPPRAPFTGIRNRLTMWWKLYDAALLGRNRRLHNCGIYNNTM